MMETRVENAMRSAHGDEPAAILARGKRRMEAENITRALPCALCSKDAEKMVTRGSIGVCAFCVLTHGEEKALKLADRKVFEDSWKAGR